MIASVNSRKNLINKAFGRGNIGIPASARGFFINAVVVGYVATANDEVSAIGTK
jgi:hypothetical protein